MNPKNPSNCKIAYISDQTFPAKKANAEQIINTVSALANEGVNIKLIVPRKWRTLFISKKKLKQQIMDFYRTRGNLEIKFIFHLPFCPFKIDKITHGLLAPLLAVILKADIIYTRNSLPALIALALGKKVLFEVYRIYGKNKKDGFLKLARQSQKSDAIGIICHSQPSRESLLALGVPENKVTVVHNGFNPELLKPLLTKAEARKSLNWRLDDKLVIFAGRIDVDKGAHSILDLAQQTPEVNYVLIGYSQNDDEDWILREADKRGLGNIKKLPWQTVENLVKYLFAADALIIPPTAGPLQKYGNTVLPIKIFIYMAAGRCIIAPALPDIKTVLNESNAVLVEPDNIEKAAKAIKKVFGEKEWADAIAQKARQDSENYTWQSRAKKIITFMNQ